MSSSEHAALPHRVVWLNTAAFTFSFAAWVALGPSARAIAADLGLSEPLTSLLRTLPILVGSFVRIPVGVLADRAGARVVFPTLMLGAALGAWTVARASAPALVLVGTALLGLAGTTFTVGVQAVTLEAPPSRRGLAIGLFGAGNVGTALTTLTLPALVSWFGWRSALDVVATTLAVGALLYAWFARPQRSVGVSWRELVEPFAHLPVWRIGLYYTASFGVFVAMTLVLVDLYTDLHGVSLERAGVLATSFTAITSLVRILGGWLADRLGAARVLRGSLVVVALALAPVPLVETLAATVSLVLVAGVGMGVAMSASLREVAETFPGSVGAVTGVVGALGGLGGFVLPSLGEACASSTGLPAAVVLPMASVAALGLVVHLRCSRTSATTTSTAR